MFAYKDRCNRFVPISLIVLFVFVSLLYPGLPGVASAYVAPQPQIGAKAAIVVEYPSGRILYQKSSHTRLAPASTTKILTAILALEYGKSNEVVTVSPQDMVRGSKMGLQSGERQTLLNLLYGLLLPSGNDAAMTIARHIGAKNQSGLAPTLQIKPVSYFTRMMNARALQLGLKDTHFVNPHGLDRAGHYSSAYDMASLTWYAMHFQQFNQIVKQRTYEAPGHELSNLNKMLQLYSGADGAKTGYTRAAGLCLITTATRGGHRLISVVLNAPRWTDDSAALLDYGFAQLSSGSVPVNTEKLQITALPVK